LGAGKEVKVCRVESSAKQLKHKLKNYLLWSIDKSNIDWMSCECSVRWLAFTEVIHGANDPTERLGFDNEMRVCRVAFNARQLY
jgi:hypothetical protein